MAARRAPAAPPAPQGGWAMEDYATAKGERLARAIAHAREKEVARAIKDTTAFLNKFFAEELDAIIADAMGQKGVVASLKKWASALVRTTKRFEPKLVAGMSPRIFRTGRKVLWDTAHLLGMKPKDLDTALFRVRAEQLAQNVTDLSRTTRERMASCIAQGVKERLTDKQMVARLRARFPALTLSRVKTIARTEMGRAADLGQLAAYHADGRVTHVSVVGCQAVEPGIPEFEGVPTCNIRNVPLKASDQLEFHINHTGMLIPSGFLTRAGNVPRLTLRGSKCFHQHQHKGGPGSGNFGHSGRPGQVGGSGGGGTAAGSALASQVEGTHGPKANNLGRPDWLTADHPFHAVQDKLDLLLAQRAVLMGPDMMRNQMNRMEAETMITNLRTAHENGVIDKATFDKKLGTQQRKLEKLRKEAKKIDKALDELQTQAQEAVQIPNALRYEQLRLGSVDPAVASRVALGVELTRQYVHADLLPHGVDVVNGGLNGTDRAYYQSNAIHITPTTTRSVVMHELAHAIEDAHPEIMARSHALVESRSGGAQAVSMTTLEPAGGYGPSEYVHPDEWQARGGSNYTGRDYGGRATEVLSMGLERLAANPLQFFAQDRQHFAHVVRSLHKMP